jgi:hypothetical protein
MLLPCIMLHCTISSPPFLEVLESRAQSSSCIRWLRSMDHGGLILWQHARDHSKWAKIETRKGLDLGAQWHGIFLCIVVRVMQWCYAPSMPFVLIQSTFALFRAIMLRRVISTWINHVLGTINFNRTYVVHARVWITHVFGCLRGGDSCFLKWFSLRNVLK